MRSARWVVGVAGRRAIVLALAASASLAVAAERTVWRDTTLREGPGPYYGAVAPLARGKAVDAGAAQGAWVSVKAGDAAGWVPESVFDKPRAGVDYAGLLGETGAAIQVSSVDIAAATKGVFAAKYGTKHDVDFKVAQGLDAVDVPASLIGRLQQPLDGRGAGPLLAKLPHRPFDNTIVLRPDAEQLLGHALVANLASSAGFADDARLTAYVNGVAAVVGAKADRFDVPYRVGILKDNGVNGFGLPGGYIILTRGLLDELRDEAELACVLAHEMAHASLYHGLREFKKREVHRRSAKEFDELNRMIGDTDNAVEKELDQLADTAYLKIIGGRAREDELEADLYGAAYAAAAGYDPAALIDLLRRIDERHGSGDVYRHHPPASERIAKLDAAIARYRLRWDGQKRLADRFAQMTGPAREPAAARSGRGTGNAE